MFDGETVKKKKFPSKKSFDLENFLSKTESKTVSITESKTKLDLKIFTKNIFFQNP